MQLNKTWDKGTKTQMYSWHQYSQYKWPPEKWELGETKESIDYIKEKNGKRETKKKKKEERGEKYICGEKTPQKNDKQKNANTKHPEKSGGRICRAQVYIHRVSLRNWMNSGRTWVQWRGSRKRMNW